MSMPALLGAVSWYSLGRGVLSPERICRIAAGLGYDTVAIADYDNLYGLPEFLCHASRFGVRPVVAARLTDPRSRDTALILSHATEGYRNLCRLISDRHCDESFELARAICRYHSGLHVISSSVKLLELIHCNTLSYYCLQSIKKPPEAIRSLAIPCVVATESVFAGSDDYELHRLLRAIDLNTTLPRVPPEQCFAQDSYIQSWKSIQTRFEVYSEALKMAEELGQCVRSRSDFGTPALPRTDLTGDPGGLLRQKVSEGALRRYGADPGSGVRRRIEHELEIIEAKGFADYFLVVDDIVRQSPRTCGRGSGAASIVSYCLGITNVDPMRYNLMFERFLTMERSDLPDIDIDFAWDERDGVLEYVFRKYGPERAAMVATHGRYGMRMALREVGRVYGLTEQELSSVTAKIPWHIYEGAASIEQHLKQGAVCGELQLDAPWPEIICRAQRLLGMPCAVGTHCGGVIITPGPIRDHVPIQYSAKGYQIIHWEKDGAEDMGLVKIDLLGNRSLAVIRDAIANLKNEGIALDERRWEPASDGATIDMLARGKTIGVFYVESPAMRLLQQKAQAGDFEHLLIHSSLIRPAANKFNREYIRRLHGGSYKPLHPLLTDILAETYGIMVYQEDVTKVAMTLAGFSLADAEGLRKAVAKKHRHGRLEDYRQRFFSGAQARGVAGNVVAEVWDMVMAFSGYSFCKPHSASYVQVSFQSAWLKAHYPAAFMASVISNLGGFYSTQAYVSEAQRLGLRVAAPDVNISDVACRSNGCKILIGLHLIKGLGLQAAQRVVQRRERGGRYASLPQFLERTGLKEAHGEKLISSGACDALVPSANRSLLFWQLRCFYRGAGCTGSAPSLRPYSRAQLLACQYDALGFLTGMHPIVLLRPHNRPGTVLLREIKMRVGSRVKFYAWCVTSRSLTTGDGAGMQFVTFEDETAIVETVLFPQVYERFARHIAQHEAFIVTGLVTEDYGAVTVEVQRVDPLRCL